MSKEIFMSDLEIFTEALKKAVENDMEPAKGADHVKVQENFGKQTMILTWNRELILTPEFAKAFWGDTYRIPIDRKALTGFIPPGIKRPFLKAMNGKGECMIVLAQDAVEAFRTNSYSRDKDFIIQDNSILVTDEFKGDYVDVESPEPAWQYHLQRLVLADDRAAYLKEYL